MGAWYVEDSMKLRHNLTLRLGMRQEFTTGWNEVAGRASNYVTDAQGVLLTDPHVGSSTFNPNNANEWWIQLHLTSDRPVAGVSTSINNGTWQALALQSWGDWAASYHAPSGSILQFQARAGDGSVALSGCYHWTDRASVTCPGGATTPPPPPTNNSTSPPPPTNNSTSPPPTNSSFSASFTPSKNGNDWWVETYVTANEPLAGVDARVNGGAWIGLTHESWGSWAKSINAPAGSTVEFRARDAAGDAVVSQAYIWPVR